MRRKRILCFCVFLFSLSPLFSQDAAIRVLQPGLRELKRSSHRLRISVDQLRMARRALREATELAHRIDPLPIREIPRLGNLWVLLHRREAQTAVASLVDDLKECALDASRMEDYQQCTAGAQSLLYPLMSLDPAMGEELFRQWPPPPSKLGEEAGKVVSQWESRLKNQYLSRLSYRDPERALALLSESPQSAGSLYATRGRLARHLASTGRKEAARQLLDQTIADFQAEDANPMRLNDYSNFLAELGGADQERFMEAFLPFTRSLANAPSNSSLLQLKSNDQTVTIDSSENLILNVIRRLRNRPTLALKVLHSVPGLTDKLDRVGGLDNFLSPTLSSRVTVTPLNSSSNSVRTHSSRSVTPHDRQLFRSLTRELRGVAITNPALARQRISETFKGPIRIQALFGLVRGSLYNSPELASLALDHAATLLPEVEPLSQRSRVLQNLIQLYRQLEGEADPRLIKDGFILADQLREEQDQNKQSPAGGLRSSPSQAFSLEVFLVSQYARINFEAAMSFIKEMPEDASKIRMLTQVAESLRRQ